MVKQHLTHDRCAQFYQINGEVSGKNAITGGLEDINSQQPMGDDVNGTTE